MIVEALSSVRVVGVAAGDQHSILCTAEGEVLTCGDGSGGKLGHGDERDLHVPRVVMGLAGKAVVAVTASDNHSLAVTVDGDVFSFGEGEGLGHGDVLRQELVVVGGRLVPRMLEVVLANECTCGSCGNEGGGWWNINK